MRDLLGHLFGVADQECSLRASLRVEIGTCHRRPAPLLRYRGHGASPARKEVSHGLFRRGRDIPRRVYADPQLIGGVPGLPARLSVEIDERAESPRLSADDRDHQRKSKRAGASERSWGPAHPQPDGQGVLQRPRVDALPRQGRPMLAGPVDVFVLTDLEKKVEVLGKQRVVVLELEAEQWEGLDERAAAGDDLRPALRQQIQRGEVLEYPHRVGRAEDRYGTGEAYSACARRCGSQNDGGSRVEVFRAMVFADSE